MQLPPTDELVLISGLAPIRAKKLRYFKDRNFASRLLPAPTLGHDRASDGLAARGHDWAGAVRTVNPELKVPAEVRTGKDGGAPEQQQERAPSRESEPASQVAKQDDALGIGDDDDDPVLGSPVGSWPPSATAYGINQGRGRSDSMVPE